MSSMVILKETEGHKAGEVISVPYFKGKEMIAAGVAKYLNAGKGVKVPAAPSPSPLSAPVVTEPVAVEPAPIPASSTPSLPDLAPTKPQDLGRRR